MLLYAVIYRPSLVVLRSNFVTSVYVARLSSDSQNKLSPSPPNRHQALSDRFLDFFGFAPSSWPSPPSSSSSSSSTNNIIKEPFSNTLSTGSSPASPTAQYSNPTLSPSTPAAPPPESLTTTSNLTVGSSPSTSEKPSGGILDSLVLKKKEKWPPRPDKWPLIWLIVSVAWICSILYANFAGRETTLENLGCELRWGGEADQLHALKILNTYLYLEVFGVKISYKMSQINLLLEDILGVFATPRSRRVRDEAAKLLSRLTANNKEIRAKLLLDENVLDLLRNYVDPDNIHVIYTIANLSTSKTGSEMISNDQNLMDSLIYTLAYTMKAQEIKHRYVQRALLRAFSNLVRNKSLPSSYIDQLNNLLLKFHHLIMFDTYSTVHYLNTITKISQNLTLLQEVPVIQQLQIQGIDLSNINQDEKQWSLFAGSSLVFISSYLFACIYQRFHHLKVHYPLNLYQKKWARMQRFSTPFVATLFFLLHHALVYGISQASDVLSFHPDDGRDPETHILGKFAWEEYKTPAQPLLMSLHLLRLPFYYLGLRYSFYSLLPSLIPWKLDSNTPPDWLLRSLPVIERFNSYIFHPPPPEEPTPQQIENLIRGILESELMMQQLLEQMYGYVDK